MILEDRGEDKYAGFSLISLWASSSVQSIALPTSRTRAVKFSGSCRISSSIVILYKSEFWQHTYMTLAMAGHRAGNLQSVVGSAKSSQYSSINDMLMTFELLSLVFYKHTADSVSSEGRG